MVEAQTHSCSKPLHYFDKVIDIVDDALPHRSLSVLCNAILLTVPSTKVAISCIRGGGELVLFDSALFRGCDPAPSSASSLDPHFPPDTIHGLGTQSG